MNCEQIQQAFNGQKLSNRLVKLRVTHQTESKAQLLRTVDLRLLKPSIHKGCNEKLITWQCELGK